MKRILLALCIVGLLASDVSPTRAGEMGPEPDGAKIFAVCVRADWDGAWQKVQPVVNGLMNRFDEEPVLFVTLDITNASVRRQAALLSKELDLEEVLGNLDEKLGSVQFVSTGERTSISAVTAEASFEQASAALRDALQFKPERAPLLF